jgi:hypothetical protein
MHTLAEIATRIESASKYPLQEIRRAPTGVFAQLATRTPDGQDARIDLAWSELELAQNSDGALVDLIKARTQEASASLERYVDSFIAPAWDKIVWAD